MSETRNPAEPERTRASDTNAGEFADQEPRQPPTLSEKEAERIREIEEFEDFMEEPTQGPLSIISDQDVPGAPG
jgi:hypothetical protein